MRADANGGMTPASKRAGARTAESRTAALAAVKQERLNAVTEAEFQRDVVQLLTLNGWRTFHVGESRKTVRRGDTYITIPDPDSAGLPDLVAIHPIGDIFVAELKRQKDRTDLRRKALQLEVLGLFTGAAIDAYLWRPSDMDEIIERARSPRGRRSGVDHG